MKIPKEVIEANLKRINESRKADKLLIPEGLLTGIKNRGQDGKPILRGQNSTKSK
jgi:hypothetical protein